MIVFSIIFLLWLYQRTLSRLLPASCRFYPSCSQYAIDALAQHGLWRGGWMAVKRLCRCHPLHPGGYDPVDSPPSCSSGCVPPTHG